MRKVRGLLSPKPTNPKTKKSPKVTPAKTTKISPNKTPKKSPKTTPTKKSPRQTPKKSAKRKYLSKIFISIIGSNYI